MAFALTPMLVLLQGHRFGVGNHDTLLSFIRRINDPAYLVSDWMLSTPPVHPVLLKGLVAPMVSYWGEAPAFLLLHLVTRFLLLAGTWRLALALLPGRHGVAVLAMLATFFEPRLAIGAHYLQGGHWEPAFLGMALAVWTLALGIRFLRGEAHWMEFAIAAGFGIVSHLFIGVPVIFVCMVGMVLLRTPLKASLAFTAAALFLGSPALLSAILGFFAPGEAPLAGKEVIQLLQFRHPHHHQPWTWPVSHLAQGALLLVAGGIAWWQLAKRDVVERPRLIIPAALLGIFLISCAAFTTLGWLQKVPLVAFMQPYRLYSLLLLLTVIAVLALMEDSARGRWLSLLAMAIPALMILRLGGNMGAVAVIAIYTITLAIVVPMSGKRVPLAPRRGTKRVLFATGVAGLTAILTLQGSLPLQEKANRLRGNHWLSRVEPRDSARAELTKWVRENTLPEDLFAIPPAIEGFRIWEQRPIVVDFKNFPYRNAEIKEWAERIALGMNVDPYIPFTPLPTEDAPVYQLVLLAHTYGARFVVAREAVVHPAVVYTNSVYTVIDLNRADGVFVR